MSDLNEQLRAEFEAHIAVALPNWHSPSAIERHAEGRNAGEYFYQHVQVAWGAWQAARRAPAPAASVQPPIKTWQERVDVSLNRPERSAMLDEIADLRAALAAPAVHARDVNQPFMIARIKRYRDVFGVSLAEAKLAVEYSRDITPDGNEFAAPVAAPASADEGVYPTDEAGYQAEAAERYSDTDDELRAAAQAVVARWDSPKWKDEPHTGEFINRLRAALALAKRSET